MQKREELQQYLFLTLLEELETIHRWKAPHDDPRGSLKAANSADWWMSMIKWLKGITGWPQNELNCWRESQGAEGVGTPDVPWSSPRPLSGSTLLRPLSDSSLCQPWAHVSLLVIHSHSLTCSFHVHQVNSLTINWWRVLVCFGFCLLKPCVLRVN